MRLRSDIQIYPAGREYVVINPGANSDPHSQLFPMNEAAALLWKSFQGEEVVPETMANLLCEHYDIEYDAALADIHQLLHTWKDFGLLV